MRNRIQKRKFLKTVNTYHLIKCLPRKENMLRSQIGNETWQLL